MDLLQVLFVLFHNSSSNLPLNRGEERRKKKEGEYDEYMFHKVSYEWFRVTQYIPELGLFYKNVGILLGGFLTVKN